MGTSGYPWVPPGASGYLWVPLLCSSFVLAVACSAAHHASGRSRAEHSLDRSVVGFRRPMLGHIPLRGSDSVGQVSAHLLYSVQAPTSGGGPDAGRALGGNFALRYGAAGPVSEKTCKSVCDRSAHFGASERHHARRCRSWFSKRYGLMREKNGSIFATTRATLRPKTLIFVVARKPLRSHYDHDTATQNLDFRSGVVEII